MEHFLIMIDRGNLYENQFIICKRVPVFKPIPSYMRKDGTWTNNACESSENHCYFHTRLEAVTSFMCHHNDLNLTEISHNDLFQLPWWRVE